VAILLVFSVAMPVPMRAQSTTHQTARQALIELLFGGGGEAFSRHLPELARKTLQNGDAIYSEIVRMSGTSRPLLARHGEVEISDSGPIIASQTIGSEYRLEIDVERDVTNGETDEIELSSHIYGNNEELNQLTMPRLTFSLKEEDKKWILVQVTAVSRVPLGDEHYLGGRLKQQQEANERGVQYRTSTIVAAEAAYAMRYQRYACTLQDLFAAAPPDDSEDSASDGVQAYFDPGQGGSDLYGYHFELSCTEAGAGRYRLAAVPVEKYSGTRTFCADESGDLRVDSGASASSCFQRGEMLESQDIRID
jgi:hypothetical protein